MNLRARSVAPTVVLVAAAFFAGSALRAQEPDKGADAKVTKETKVRELLELNGVADFSRTQYVEVCDNLAKLPNVPKSFTDEFRKGTKPSELLDLAVGVHMKNVDEDVIDSAIEFYKTPNGKRLAKAQPQLTKGMDEAVKKWSQETVVRIAAKIGIDGKNGADKGGAKKKDDKDDE